MTTRSEFVIQTEMFEGATFCFGELELLRKVLQSAIADACDAGTWIGQNSEKDRKYWKTRALWWIASDSVSCDEQHGISFGFICEALEINPKKIREAVRTKRLDLVLGEARLQSEK